jgi:SAM-dependent methyltransferase
MPSRPQEVNSVISLVTDLLLVERRQDALEKLAQDGYIHPEALGAWQAEFASHRYQLRSLNMILAPNKLKLDALLEQAGGELTERKVREIVQRLVQALAGTGNAEAISYPQIATRRVLDYGAGSYSPLCASLVLYANGFSEAIACEPFPISLDYATCSFAQTVQWLLFSPQSFNYSGIPADLLKQRVAALQLDRAQHDLAAFHAGQVEVVDFGGVRLVRQLDGFPENSVDLIFSNSVLEHVTDLLSEIRSHRALLKAGGLCAHTVDFSDHRSIDPEIHLFQMYYDGILDEINGLRPSQLEKIFGEAGFTGAKINWLSAPVGYLDSTRPRVTPYENLPLDELAVRVNSYVLQK